MSKKKKFRENNVTVIIGIPFLLVGLGFLFGSGVTLGSALHSSNMGSIMGMFSVFATMGVIFAGIGMLLAGIAVGRANRNKEIYHNGHMLRAVVTGVSPDFSVRVNGRPAMSYICDAIDDRTGKWHRFRSAEGAFKVPPAEVLSVVDVYVEGDNNDVFWIDIPSIRQCTHEYTDEQLDKFFEALTDDVIDLSDQRLNAYAKYQI